jgi:hypothetical protein
MTSKRQQKKDDRAIRRYERRLDVQESYLALRNKRRIMRQNRKRTR